MVEDARDDAGPVVKSLAERRTGVVDNGLVQRPGVHHHRVVQVGGVHADVLFTERGRGGGG